jgi:hypothetical protein
MLAAQTSLVQSKKPQHERDAIACLLVGTGNAAQDASLHALASILLSLGADQLSETNLGGMLGFGGDAAPAAQPDVQLCRRNYAKYVLDFLRQAEEDFSARISRVDGAHSASTYLSKNFWLDTKWLARVLCWSPAIAGDVVFAGAGGLRAALALPESEARALLLPAWRGGNGLAGTRGVRAGVHLKLAPLVDRQEVKPLNWEKPGDDDEAASSPTCARCVLSPGLHRSRRELWPVPCAPSA